MSARPVVPRVDHARRNIACRRIDRAHIVQTLKRNLRHLLETWPTLPEPVRAGILAMIEATAGA